MNDKEYEMIGESIWDTYKRMASLLAETKEDPYKAPELKGQGTGIEGGGTAAAMSAFSKSKEGKEHFAADARGEALESMRGQGTKGTRMADIKRKTKKTRRK